MKAVVATATGLLAAYHLYAYTMKSYWGIRSHMQYGYLVLCSVSIYLFLDLWINRAKLSDRRHAPSVHYDNE